MFYICRKYLVLALYENTESMKQKIDTYNLYENTESKKQKMLLHV